jgi:hypothetical protein
MLTQIVGQMGVLQRYFEYMYDPTDCGIPTATLLGERKDYADILKRIEKLTEYSEEPTRFAELLRPVVRSLVACFDAPADDAAIVDFWTRMVHYSGGSGVSYLSGWIVAFCFWDEKGKLLPEEWWVDMVKAKLAKGPEERLYYGVPFKHNHLGGVVYHQVDIEKVPAGYTTCPITILGEYRRLKTNLLAGSVGFRSTEAYEFLTDSQLLLTRLAL